MTKASDPRRPTPPPSRVGERTAVTVLTLLIVLTVVPVARGQWGVDRRRGFPVAPATAASAALERTPVSGRVRSGEPTGDSTRGLAARVRVDGAVIDRTTGAAWWRPPARAPDAVVGMSLA